MQPVSLRTQRVRVSACPLTCALSSQPGCFTVVGHTPFAVEECRCHGGKVHVSPSPAAAWREVPGNARDGSDGTAKGGASWESGGCGPVGEGQDNGPLVLPPGVRATDRVVAVEVQAAVKGPRRLAGNDGARGIGGDGGAGAGVVGVRHFRLPVLECHVLPEGTPVSLGSPHPACTTASSRVVVVHPPARTTPSPPLPRIHFLDITSLSTQDNTLLRHCGTGEVLPPSSLLCATKMRAKGATRDGSPSQRSLPALVKRRRIVLLHNEKSGTAGHEDRFELVSFVLKQRATR